MKKKDKENEVQSKTWTDQMKRWGFPYSSRKLQVRQNSKWSKCFDWKNEKKINKNKRLKAENEEEKERKEEKKNKQRKKTKRGKIKKENKRRKKRAEKRNKEGRNKLWIWIKDIFLKEKKN